MNITALVRRFLPLLLLILSLTGCARPEPTLVVVVGGLGLSQLGDLRHAVIKECPEATVVSAGAWDAYKSDLKSLATKKPHEHIIFIGHSFGCESIAKTAADMPKVDLTVFIDPAWDDFHLSPTISKYLWYRRSNFDIEREAKIIGATPKIINGNHNGIPHSPELIAEVVAAVNATANSSAPKSQKHTQTASAAPTR